MLLLKAPHEVAAEHDNTSRPERIDDLNEWQSSACPIRRGWSLPGSSADIVLDVVVE